MGPWGYKATELAVVADTADDFVFGYRKLDDVPEGLYYSGIAEAVDVLEVAWRLPNLVLGDYHTGVVAGDTETVLACRKYAEVLVVGGDHTKQLVKGLLRVRHTVAATPERVGRNPGATAAIVSAVVV